MLNRKTRMLLLSALILTLIFLLITSSNGPNVSEITSDKLDLDSVVTEKPTKEEIRQKEEVALKLKDSNNNLNDVVRNPKNGEIDESKVMQAEEIISGKKITKSAPKELLKEENAAAAITADEASAVEAPTFDLAKEFKDILNVSPVVIFSKTYCPYSKRLKSLLTTQYNITPEPAVVELDKHQNGAELQAYIGEKSGRRTVPNLFIKGVSRGGSDEMQKLHDLNTLLDNLIEWGEKSISVEKVNAPSNS